MKRRYHSVCGCPGNSHNQLYYYLDILTTLQSMGPREGLSLEVNREEAFQFTSQDLAKPISIVLIQTPALTARLRNTTYVRMYLQ